MCQIRWSQVTHPSAKDGSPSLSRKLGAEASQNHKVPGVLGWPEPGDAGRATRRD